MASTLWILAIITVAVGFFSLWTQQTLDQVRQRQQNLQAEIDMQGTQATVLYLLGTQQMTIAGLTTPTDKESIAFEDTLLDDDLMGGISILPVGDEIALDDRPYQGLGRALFSLQDEGGLLGLNIFWIPWLERLLGLLGTPAEQRGPLLAKLHDYIDEDDLHRINGAEAYHYRQRDLPPPPNRFLETSWETKNILDWGEQSGLWEDRRLPRLTTVARAGLPNLNTAPALVLQALGGIDKETAERMLSVRRKQPFLNLGDVSRATGKPLHLDPMEVLFFPADSVRLTLWHRELGRRREIHIKLTPQADQQRPWEIEYALSIPLTTDQKHAVAEPLTHSIFAAPLSAEQY